MQVASNKKSYRSIILGYKHIINSFHQQFIYYVSTSKVVTSMINRSYCNEPSNHDPTSSLTILKAFFVICLKRRFYKVSSIHTTASLICLSSRCSRHILSASMLIPGNEKDIISYFCQNHKLKHSTYVGTYNTPYLGCYIGSFVIRRLCYF